MLYTRYNHANMQEQLSVNDSSIKYKELKENNFNKNVDIFQCHKIDDADSDRKKKRK